MSLRGLPRAPTFGIEEETYEDHTDVEIDWVLVYDFSHIDVHHAVKEYRTLIDDLETRDLQVQARHGYGTTILVLIRVPRNLLGNEVYRSRVKDWLHGIVHTRPVGNASTVVEADTPSEALRSVYHLVTWTQEQGGAGITAGVGPWKRVTASFPPQATPVNGKMLRRFAARTTLQPGDLDEIRAVFGEKVAFYYAFIQSYSIFLLVPSAAGVLSYLGLRSYSPLFSAFISLWSIVFVEYWRRQEIDLSLRWDVKGANTLKVNRPQYVWDEEHKDPITGEVERNFSTRKRLSRQALFLPFALLSGVALGTVLVITFVLEAWLKDVDAGSQQPWILSYLPTIVLSLCLPYVTSFLEDIGSRLSEYENYRTADEHNLAEVQKSFVMNFVTSFLPIILTAYVYVPYGAKLMPPLLEFISPKTPLAGSSLSDDPASTLASVNIDPLRLQEEVIGLSMTAQAMNFGEELVIPYLQRRYRQFWRRWRVRHHRSTFERSHRETASSTVSTPFVDAPHEKRLLARLRFEGEAETYDVQTDIMEMTVQFGYLTLFSCVWPLMPLGFLINNWVELRGDFWKLARESRRPPPIRGEGIGASLGALEFLTWLGSLSSAALVYIYSYAEENGEIKNFHLSGLLLSLFIAEQAYLAARVLVSAIFERIGSEALRDEERRRYMVRKRYLETFSEEASGTSKRLRSKTYANERRPSSSRRSTSRHGASPALSPAIGTIAEGDEQNPFAAHMSASHESAVETSSEPFPTLTPLQTEPPTIVFPDATRTGDVEAQYKTAAAERFWTEVEEAGVDATEAGVRLIVALKRLQGQHLEQMGERQKADGVMGQGATDSYGWNEKGQRQRKQD